MANRLRVTRNERLGEWSFSISRSVWPRPLPRGMALYAIRVLWWNLILEHDLRG